MERTPEGYCCWPNQHWVEEQNRCVGPPHCPPGLLGSGAECVPSEPGHTDPTPGGEAQQPTQSPPPERMPWEEPAGTTRAVTRTSGGPDTGLIAAGLAMFLAGWIPPIGVGVALMGSSGSCDRASAAIFIVPVGGPLAGLGVNGGHACPRVDDSLWALGVVDALLQTAGLAVFIAGLAVTTERVSVIEEVRLDVGIGRVQLSLGF